MTLEEIKYLVESEKTILAKTSQMITSVYINTKYKNDPEIVKYLESLKVPIMYSDNEPEIFIGTNR